MPRLRARRTRPGRRRRTSWVARSSRRRRSAARPPRPRSAARSRPTVAGCGTSRFAHAYRNPGVAAIVGFRYISDATRRRPGLPCSARASGSTVPRRSPGARVARRGPARARSATPRGEPAHLPRLIVRLMRVAFARNAVARGASRQPSARRQWPSCAALREDATRMAARQPPRPGGASGSPPTLDARFAAARFPFATTALLPTLVVRATAGDHGLDSTFRADAPWSNDSRRAFIERGYELTDRARARPRVRRSVGLWRREELRDERL